jgi:hypothetical protein
MRHAGPAIGSARISPTAGVGIATSAFCGLPWAADITWMIEFDAVSDTVSRSLPSIRWSPCKRPRVVGSPLGSAQKKSCHCLVRRRPCTASFWVGSFRSARPIFEHRDPFAKGSSLIVRSSAAPPSRW